MIKLNDKIKELIKIVGNLNKLMLKVIELAGTITLLVLAVKSILMCFKNRCGGEIHRPFGGYH